MKAAKGKSEPGASLRKPNLEPTQSEKTGLASASKTLARRAGPTDRAEDPFLKTEAANRATRPPTQSPTGQQTVRIEVAMPSAHEICLAGSFNDWDPARTRLRRTDDGTWATDLALAPGTYEYRLVVDGQWMPDPNSSRSAPNPYGELNSVLIVAPTVRA